MSVTPTARSSSFDVFMSHLLCSPRSSSVSDPAVACCARVPTRLRCLGEVGFSSTPLRPRERHARRVARMIPLSGSPAQGRTRGGLTGCPLSS